MTFIAVILTYFSPMTNDPDDLAFDVRFEEDYEMNLKRTLKIKTSYINHSNKKLEKVKSHRRKS